MLKRYQRAGNRRECSSSRLFLRRIPCDDGARPSPDRVRPCLAHGGHHTNRTKLLRQRSATHGRRVGNRRERSSNHPFFCSIPCHDGARPNTDHGHTCPPRGGLFQRNGGRGWEMLAEYSVMDAMEPLPQEFIGRELDMEKAAEIDEHQP